MGIGLLIFWDGAVLVLQLLRLIKKMHRLSLSTHRSEIVQPKVGHLTDTLVQAVSVLDDGVARKLTGGQLR